MVAVAISEDMNVRIAGQATSPGLVKGRAFVHRNLLDALSVPRAIATHQVGEELDRVDRALETVLEDLKVSALRIEAHSGPKLAAIFGAHETMLHDSHLREEIRTQIEGELVGAAQALAHVFRRWQKKFREKPQGWLQERADDLADLEGRLLREIAGVKTTALERMPRGRVLVAHRLLPSDTVALPQRGVIGIVLEFGGPGSHAALLARALGIPTVAQIPNATVRIADGQELIVDGFAGEVILSPDLATQARFDERMKDVETNVRRAKRMATEPVRTADGVEVAVMANVGSRVDVIAAVENGADGVGLYRTEQFYLARNTPPSEADLLAELREVFAPLGQKPITVRLLDLGADKPVSYLNFPIEDDPFLGCRGVRLLLRYPDLLDTQLKALLEFSRDHELRILVPLVTVADDMAEVCRRLRAIADRAGLAKLPPLGAMIETPAAALCIGDIIQHADFLSIGTNDLTQFTMAAGRENPLVNDYFVESHPAVLRLIRIVVEEAGNTPVAVCGELAAQLDCISTLLDLGVRNLSVAPPLVPGVKETIRQASTSRVRSGG
jgi:phosphoenolpyruvate-protein phosphotransferase